MPNYGLGFGSNLTPSGGGMNLMLINFYKKLSDLQLMIEMNAMQQFKRTIE